MSNEVVVHKNRTNTIIVDLGMDISGDEWQSQIRAEPDVGSTLIAEWDVSFETDGTNGRLVLVLEELITSQIAPNSGYMDLLRISGSAPLPVFDRPLEVSFRGSVTLFDAD